MQENFQSILVIATRQLGDVLVTTPLIHAARAQWPQARIDVLGFKGTMGLLQGNPDLNELIEVDAGAGWRRSMPLIRRLWRRYDLALISQYSDRAHLYGWVAARVRAGLVPAGRSGWWKRLLNRRIPRLPGDAVHVLLEKQNLLSPWGGDTAPPLVQLPRRHVLPAELKKRLARRYVVMQVPSLVRYKQWPVENFAQVARALAAEGTQVVLTGGPSPADRALVAQAAALADAPNVINAAGQLDLQAMTTLLKGAALYVGPDTSITHLAAACGTPVIALYGPIDPRLWGPWPVAWPAQQPYESRGPRQARGNIVLLQGSQPCVPCNGAGCEKHPNSRSDCLETMAPERVLHEARGILRAAAAETEARQSTL